MTHSLNINGRTVIIDADGDTPLLWALRDGAGLTGTKYGCGIGACGACTVHIDGAAVRSCGVTIAEAVGTRITTIEGLSPDRSHPVQRAWLAEQVPQCGYCQSGMIMTAAALLKETPQPTDDEIAAAMTNRCRRGTYPRVARAIKRASGQGAEGVR